MYRLSTLLAVLVLAACSTKYEVISGDDPKMDTGQVEQDPLDSAEPVDTGDPGEVEDTGDYEQWAEATLVVLSPESGAFIELGEPSTFEAMVYDSWGEETDFEEIDWTSNVDDGWQPQGRLFDDELVAGEHDLTASARLPNGDRLAYTVGDVLVQSPYAGTYTGTLIVDIDLTYNGVDYVVSCAGGTTLVVDITGENATGTSDCVVSLMGYDMDLSFIIDMQNDDGSMSGTIAADLSWFEWEFSSEGSISTDGEMELGFDDDVMGYMGVGGELAASRISRETVLGD